MKYLIAIMIILLGSVFNSCMPESKFDIPSFEDRQLIVTEVDPAEDAIVDADAAVSLSFSAPVDSESLTRQSIAVIADPNMDDEYELAEKIVDGEISVWRGEYILSEDGKKVTFKPEETYIEGSDYVVAVTEALRSIDYVPFNQDPGATPKPFLSKFKISGGLEGDTGDPGGSSNPDVDVPKIRPSWLIITELFYDVSGADSNGDVFIELAGEAGTEITDYELLFVNGSDGGIYDTIKMPEGSFIPDDSVFVIADSITGSPGVSHIEDADYIINFDPQNGPDAVQLVDEKGNLLDVLGYGEPLLEFAENGLVAYEGTPAQDVASGMSLTRVDTFDTDDNSLDFIQKETPSPGELEVQIVQ